MAEPCLHVHTEYRDRSRALWCVACGQKTLTLQERPCGECRSFVLLADRRQTGSCTRKMISVLTTMLVAYDPARERPCFNPKPTRSA